MQTTTPPLLQIASAFTVIPDTRLPARMQLRFLDKGPYWKRRNRKMQRDPRNWSEPQVYITGRTILCHPSLYDIVLEKVRAQCR